MPKLFGGRPELILLIFVGGVMIGLFLDSYIGTSSFHNGTFEKVQLSEIEVNVDDLKTPENPEDFDNVDLSEFWRVWSLIESNYTPPIDSKMSELKRDERLYNAIRGLSSFEEDPYTNFFPPRETKLFEENIVNSEFFGIGIYIGVRNGLLTVISPLKGTPAEKAGLKARDVILEVNGISTEGFTAEDAVNLIRGEKNTEVNLQIGRVNEEPFYVDITRANITIPTIETEIKDDVFIIAVRNFSRRLPEAFLDAIKELDEAKLDKVILDFRGNPGGLLNMAIHLSSFFIEKGEPIVYQYSKDLDPKVYRSKGYDVFDRDLLKMVILIDGSSASASEIAAYAIRHYNKYKIVGAPSFGKGSVQELINLRSGSSLKITTSHWLTPDKEKISNTGIEPDVLVEIPEDPDPDIDYILDKAIEVLNSGEYKVEL